MKLISLLKAILSSDMNLFKYSAKRNSSKLNKVLFPVVLFTIVCFAIGSYAYLIASELVKVNLTFVMLSIFIIMVSILTFIEGIYKSQGILFDAKDNDLLFSLPIKKYKILLLRIFKLLIFQFIYNLMFLLPAFVVYVYFEHPGVNFYIISAIMALLVPIIPTVVSAVLGYVVKMISSKFKAKKIIQTILSAVVFLGIFYLSFSIEGFINNIANNAGSINDMLVKIYYPVGLYINLITQYNVVDLIKLLLVNIVPLCVFIFIGQIFYFGIISKLKVTNSSKVKKGKVNFSKKGKIEALVIKELRRYFSSTTYMFNTSFGLILSVVVSIGLCVSGKETFNNMFGQYGIDTGLSINVLFYFFILFVGAFTSITSSSISLEGKTINITKSLPISEKEILNAKILTCFVLEIPFLAFANTIFITSFKPSLAFSFFIIGLSLIIVMLSACIGLIINLKYPKMDATSDTEVVKQSMSSMISVFIGMGIFIGSILVVGLLSQYINLDLLIIGHFVVISIFTLFAYIYLMSKGTKEYSKINV